MCPLYCPSHFTDFLWAAQSDFTEAEEELAVFEVQYKQMELQTSVAEFFMYTLFIVQTFMAGPVLKVSATCLTFFPCGVCTVLY